MQDRDFFDALFQQFAKTTRAEDTYWMSEKSPDEESEDDSGVYDIWSVDKDQNRHLIATELWEVDADFITAIHGCLPDLVRRMHDALDEADRADKDHDLREQELFRVSLENEELLAALAESDAKLEVMRSKAGDALWKIERPM